MGEPVTFIAGPDAPAPADMGEAEDMSKSGGWLGKFQSLSDLIPLGAPRREAGERSAECPEMRWTPPNIDWGWRRESTAPGVELGRAMDAPDQVSGSDRPEGEAAERLLTAEKSEESGEKPKEEEEESAALGSEEMSLTADPGYSVSRRGRSGLLSPWSSWDGN